VCATLSAEAPVLWPLLSNVVILAVKLRYCFRLGPFRFIFTRSWLAATRGAAAALKAGIATHDDAEIEAADAWALMQARPEWVLPHAPLSQKCDGYRGAGHVPPRRPMCVVDARLCEHLNFLCCRRSMLKPSKR